MKVHQGVARALAGTGAPAFGRMACAMRIVIGPAGGQGR